MPVLHHASPKELIGFANYVYRFDSCFILALPTPYTALTLALLTSGSTRFVLPTTISTQKLRFQLLGVCCQEILQWSERNDQPEFRRDCRASVTMFCVSEKNRCFSDLR